MGGCAPPPELSIVVPMKNEAPNVAALTERIVRACAGRPFEILLVDDGSDDGTGEAISDMRLTHPMVRHLRHAVSAGQSAAVHSGVQHARGAIVCTLDGDGQNPPEEIPALIAPFSEPGADTLGLVAGQRVGRRDTLSKRTASLFANTLRSSLLRDNTRDTGCGLKAFRRAAFLELPYFNNMHRYLPALFTAYGWQVRHVDVTHAARIAGSTKYNNLQRALVGLHDLIGVTWLIRRRKRARADESGPKHGGAP